jgi:SAM-dependent methyltransferase
MTTNILDLREFYASAQGRIVRGLLRRHVQKIWPDLAGETVLGLGYPLPLLRPWLGKARLLGVMPPAQGGVYWPREGPNLIALASFEALPFEDESVHRAVIMHGLETASDPEVFLAEIWRVLKGNGRVLMVVPNRRGFWAHSDQTPFGTGQPYSSGQLRALLRGEGFVVDRISGALYLPPTSSRLLLAASTGFERAMAPLCPGFGGLLLIEASKQLFEPLLTRARSTKSRLVLPLPFPVPTRPVTT